jgi:hypothetical protein
MQINQNWISKIKDVERWQKYSQNGEEAFIEYILNHIPSKGNHLVDIGANDGYFLSNTRHFIQEGFTHLLIDGDAKDMPDVKEHFIKKDNIIDILRQYNTPVEFDLLSLDIDGIDLYVLEEVLKNYKPSLIIAEYNAMFPPNDSKTIAYDENFVWQLDDYFGFSFAAGIKCAEKYDYVCIHENDSLNLYFIPSELANFKPEMNYTILSYHPESGKTDWVDY